ncbi:MAG: asparagine synthase (glutamine-hydrolyzing) [Luteibaculum sp.]
MCGIAGIFGVCEDRTAALPRMLKAMEHRGPDAEGTFYDNNLALGHRRLSIIDLSAAANQPFISNDGNLILVFNGEIYNYRKLKDQLSDYPFRTNSDTEVIIAAYQKWGSNSFAKLDGMFAFFLFDKNENRVFGVRDRLGIKPLYYAKSSDGKSLLFASELRALLKSGLVSGKLSENALSQYLVFQHRFGNDTLLEEVSEVPPGNWFAMNPEQIETPRFVPFWKLAQNKVATPATPEEAKNLVRQKLFAAVEKRLVADVPFGAFLSGGMDSSALVGIMSQLSEGSVHTFHVSFTEEEYSEAKYAETIAKKWNTNHSELRLSPTDLLNEIPDAIAAYDYPGVDGINSWVVSKMTKKAGITMALSGSGGDELFGGYPVFRHVKAWQDKSALRKITSPLSLFSGLLPDDKWREAAFLKALGKDAGSIFHLFRSRLNPKLASQLMQGFTKDYSPEIFGEPQKGSIYSWVSEQEINTYLRSVLLRDTDQMSMAHALEVRVPFLDHELVELMLSLPDAFKIGPSNKNLMRLALGQEILPDEIVFRKKMGFVFPWKEWLLAELSSLAQESILKLGNNRLFNEAALKSLWADFNSGKVSYTAILSLLTLSSWMQRNGIE